MATKNQTTEETTPRPQDEAQQLFTVDELRESRRLAKTVFFGVCAQQRWRPGKAVSKEEFDTAIKRFLKGGGAHAAGR